MKMKTKIEKQVEKTLRVMEEALARENVKKTLRLVENVR